MRFEWRKPCECGSCDVRYTTLAFSHLQIRYFNDFDDWFVYIHWKNRYWRFSSAGYLSGRKGGRIRA